MATVGTIRGKNKAMRSVAESEGSNSAAVSRRRDTALLKSRLYSLRKRVVPLALALIIAGCSAYRPYIPTGEGHIDKPKAQADRAIPPPARVTTFVPPPKPTVKPQTYTVHNAFQTPERMARFSQAYHEFTDNRRYYGVILATAKKA